MSKCGTNVIETNNIYFFILAVYESYIINYFVLRNPFF